MKIRYPIYLNDLDPDLDPLPRKDLVDKLVEGLSANKQFLIYAPPASGKTSLVSLLEMRLDNRESEHMLAGMPVIRIDCDCYKSQDAVTVLKRTGIDIQQMTCELQRGILVLDDCHHWFDNREVFNALYRKANHWIPQGVIVLFIATALFSNPSPSPAFFKNIPSLRAKDFILSDKEVTFLAEQRALEYGETFADVLAIECAGRIGLYTLTIAFLQLDLKRGLTKPYGEDREKAILQYFFSKPFVHHMSRCFMLDISREKQLKEPTMKQLKSMFVSRTPIMVSEEYNEGLYRLVEAGILTANLETHEYEFSCPYAQRYLVNYVFEGTRSEKRPREIKGFIKSVIEGMSSSQLAGTTVQSMNDFPKEAAFQQLFMASLVAHTPPSTSICPELGRRFRTPSEKQSNKIEGEIDFYINGDLRWGIEILIKGNRLKDHLARCSPKGKYGPLGMNDYVVLDFRSGNEQTLRQVKIYQTAEMEPDVLKKREKRITVVFPRKTDDTVNYEQCTVLIGAGEDYTEECLELQP